MFMIIGFTDFTEGSKSEIFSRCDSGASNENVSYIHAFNILPTKFQRNLSFASLKNPHIDAQRSLFESHCVSILRNTSYDLQQCYGHGHSYESGRITTECVINSYKFIHPDYRVILLLLFTVVHPFFLWKLFRKLFLIIANSCVFIHPIRIPGILYELEKPRIMQTPIRRDPEQAIEYIYLPIDSYLIKEYWHIVLDNLGRRHIGIAFEITDEYNDIVLCVDVLVSPFAFFNFPMQTAKHYLMDSFDDDCNVVILASELEHNIRIQGLYDLPTSPLIIKTHWIRIIQRRWKNIYAERNRRLKLRGGLKQQKLFELTGNYGIHSVGGLRGMLSDLFVESKQI